MILLEGKEIKPTTFPDGTSQVWKIDLSHLQGQEVEVIWKFESEAEFMHLAQLKDILDVNHFRTRLYMPYLPYARQDKVTSNESTFALFTFARLLNRLKFDWVSAFDVHSYAAECLISSFENVSPVSYVLDAIEQVKPDALCYPDKGAVKKYSTVIGGQFMYGEKHRNQRTGKIEGYELFVKLGMKRDCILIVDDICDGGATFIELAKALKGHGVKEIHLYVSHGIFSRGIEVLREAGIQRIFTKEGELS